MVKMIAIEPINGLQPGDPFECGNREADQLIARSLARLEAPAHRNKMAPAASNKADPTEAAGEARLSAASQAARAYAQPILTPSRRGPGRPRKAEAAPPGE